MLLKMDVFKVTELVMSWTEPSIGITEMRKMWGSSQP